MTLRCTAASQCVRPANGVPVAHTASSGNSRNMGRIMGKPVVTATWFIAATYGLQQWDPQQQKQPTACPAWRRGLRMLEEGRGWLRKRTGGFPADA